MADPAKLSFIEVRAQHHFDIPELARLADVPPGIVHSMLVGIPVSALAAQRVLAVVSFTAGAQYSLDSVDIKVVEGNNDTKQSE